MRQYIDRETVRRMVYSSRNNLQMQNIFEQIPIADVRENVHGEWEDNYPILCEFQSLRCNQCHCLVPKKNFCCNCGAIMREVTK